MSQRIKIPFANTGDKTAIPATDPNGFVNLTTGYPPDYAREIGADPAAKSVEREQQNWLFNLITSELKDWQDNGIPWYFAPADKPEGYAINAMVRHTNSLIYRSLKNNNLSPISDGLSWEAQQTQAALLAKIPIKVQGLVTSATNFNEMMSGNWFFGNDAVLNSCPNHPPAAVSGSLMAYRWDTNPSEYFVVQTYQDYHGEVFYRSFYTGTGWSAWRQVADDIELSNRGYYGSPSLGSFDSTEARKTGFYYMPQGSTGQPSNQPHHCVTTQYYGSILTQTAVGANNAKVYVRTTNGGSSWAGWFEQANEADLPMREQGPKIATGVDFQGIAQGSYELDAASAAASYMQPSNEAGWLECKWSDPNNGSSDRFQRYTTLSGTVYNRSLHASIWSAWRSTARSPGELVESFGQAIPAGTLACNGQAVSRAVYADLFNAIGTLFGAGNGSTTFNVPTINPQITVVAGPANVMGQFTPGSVISHNHVLTDPGHNHSLSDPGHTHGVNDPGHTHTIEGQVTGFFQYSGGGGNPGIGNPTSGTFSTFNSVSNISVLQSSANVSVVPNTSNTSINAAGSEYNLACGVYVQMFIAF